MYLTTRKMTRYDQNYLQLHCITLLIIKINSVIITMLSYLHLPSVFVFQKENEKAVDELRKFYSAQAVKHKENMEQAVNHKVHLGYNLLTIM